MSKREELLIILRKELGDEAYGIEIVLADAILTWHERQIEPIMKVYNNYEIMDKEGDFSGTTGIPLSIRDTLWNAIKQVINDNYGNVKITKEK